MPSYKLFIWALRQLAVYSSTINFSTCSVNISTYPSRRMRTQHFMRPLFSGGNHPSKTSPPLMGLPLLLCCCLLLLDVSKVACGTTSRHESQNTPPAYSFQYPSLISSIFRDIFHSPNFALTFLSPIEEDVATHATLERRTESFPAQSTLNKPQADLSGAEKRASSGSTATPTPITSSIRITDASKNVYICHLPSAHTEALNASSRVNNKPSSSSTANGERERKRHKYLQEAFNKLEELKDPSRECLQLDDEDGWTYQYCHGSYLRQVMLDEESKPTELDYVLGQKIAEYTYNPKPALFNRGDGVTFNMNPNYGHPEHANATVFVDAYINHLPAPYFREYWGDGHQCSTTGLPRITEIQFHCGIRDELRVVSEHSVCDYLAIVTTPRICGPIKKMMALSSGHPTLPESLECQMISGEGEGKEAERSASAAPTPSSMDSTNAREHLESQTPTSTDSPHIQSKIERKSAHTHHHAYTVIEVLKRRTFASRHSPTTGPVLSDDGTWKPHDGSHYPHSARDHVNSVPFYTRLAAILVADEEKGDAEGKGSEITVDLEEILGLLNAGKLEPMNPLLEELLAKELSGSLPYSGEDANEKGSDKWLFDLLLASLDERDDGTLDEGDQAKEEQLEKMLEQLLASSPSAEELEELVAAIFTLPDVMNGGGGPEPGRANGNGPDKVSPLLYRGDSQATEVDWEKEFEDVLLSVARALKRIGDRQERASGILNDTTAHRSPTSKSRHSKSSHDQTSVHSNEDDIDEDMDEVGLAT